MSIWDRIRKTLQAVREYPRAVDNLDVARFELRQAQQALEKSEQERKSLRFTSDEQREYINFLTHRLEALQDALLEFCPQMSTLEDMEQLYEVVSSNIDTQGFLLFRMAEKLTGIDVPAYFPYEDNSGLFEQMEGRQLLHWLAAVRFDAVEWEIVPGSCYEKAILGEVDTSTPEYQAFEQELYRAVLTRMGFGDLLVPEAHMKSQKKEVAATEEKTTELRLYTRLIGEIAEREYDVPEPLDSVELTAFQEVILQGIEDYQVPGEEERGLMVYFDGSKAVDEKVVSFFPSVEEIDGELYGVAVCQVKGTLTPGELDELKEYCRIQFIDGWGEGFEQRPHWTGYADLYVSFQQSDHSLIMTKTELEAAKKPVRSQTQRGGER